MTSRVWYIDSSIALRAIREESLATRAWFDSALAAGDRLVTSRLLELEVTRVLKNADLDVTTAADLVDRFYLVPLTDDLVDVAMSFDERLGGADSLHIATASRLGSNAVTIATHDRQMAVAAAAIGFEVTDPVTDDPGSPPVA